MASSKPALSVRDVDSDSEKLTDDRQTILQFNAPVVPSLAFTSGKVLERVCRQDENHSTGEQVEYRLYNYLT